MGPERSRLRALGVVEEELLGRGWRGAFFGNLLVAFTELAYVFIDYRVFRGALLLPVLRALHVLWVLGVLGLLFARRRRLTPALINGGFVGGVLPFLPIFALAESFMTGSGLIWVPMTGHRLVMLAIGVLAPTGLWLGGGLIAAFALEAGVLWFALGLGSHPGVRSPWEPWVTLIYGGVALTMLAYRVRSHTIELKLREVRAEAEALERLARLFLAVRDATNTPLQTLELSIALLRQRSPESEPTLAAMERAVHRIRSLTQRLGSVDPLLVWREGDESFDADAMLRHLEEDLARELERRRH
ncbi:MAG TPA: hypothetical protein VFZ09_28635 [Archangium sp.]|uniref:hypothetical protein n=1 Tax=Archangium sp. TaxID=1872627 RepID=UPI002E2FDBF9|nr:hypothetical protein [Archangium sp.]HEX5750232.1 hypothetical protein [Archangium sp.]